MKHNIKKYMNAHLKQKEHVNKKRLLSLFLIQKKDIHSYYYLGDHMYQELRNYLSDRSFKLILTTKYLNILNYSKIIILEDEKIELLIPNKILKIKGKNLKLKRIMNSEILIEGDILELKLVEYE